MCNDVVARVIRLEPVECAGYGRLSLVAELKDGRLWRAGIPEKEESPAMAGWFRPSLGE